jgi:S-adenosylmethionine:tRNA ribosyltransferase-isomerase
MAYNISDFDYDLPQELIAQTPIEPRDTSRLLVVHRDSGKFEHRRFREIGAYLHPGDLLIANQSRVLPARLLGHRAGTGGAVEVLLLAERPDLGPDYWETLVHPGRRLREGSLIVFGDETSHNADKQQRVFLQAEVLERTEAGGRIVRFTIEGTRAAINSAHRDEAYRKGGVDPRPHEEMGGSPNLTVRDLIEQLGHMPLPPYIHKTLQDPERYQTVYSRITGSAAAPTAGLHFTLHLLEQLRQQGIRVGFVTLHVGLDTFRPIESEDIRDHKMQSEEIDLDAATAELINETRHAGGRVIAVGTTAVRVLESIASFYEGRIEPYHGATRLFITPGYHFQVVDAMITNFHLPRSTLLLLVSAFASKTLIQEAYQEAMRERYRFYSFGDAMLML